MEEAASTPEPHRFATYEAVDGFHGTYEQEMLNLNFIYFYRSPLFLPPFTFLGCSGCGPREGAGGGAQPPLWASELLGALLGTHRPTCTWWRLAKEPVGGGRPAEKLRADERVLQRESRECYLGDCPRLFLRREVGTSHRSPT